MSCPMPEEHEAHMAANGECPWCGDQDMSKVLTGDEFEANWPGVL